MAAAGHFDHTDVNRGLATGKTLRETLPGRRRQALPIAIRQKRAETQIVESGTLIADG
jgi:hypothetical protein